MNKLYGDPIYLDLFDDGIPARNPWVAPGDFERQLADTLRFQILLAVLFDRKVVVPEAWVVSSPMFLHVAGEVMHAFNQVGGVLAKAPWPSGRAPLESPFIFVFSKVEGSPRPVQRLTQALAWRIGTGRRLMFSRALGSETSAFAAAETKRLRAELAAVLPDVDAPPREHRDVPGQLFSHLQSSDGTVLCNRYTEALATLYEHLDRPLWTAPAMVFNEAAYKAGLMHEVGRVQSAVMAPADGWIEDTAKLDGFRTFFKAVKESFTPQSEVMDMWRLLAALDISAEDKKTVEAFGRFVLNRAYASSLGAADLSALSFDAYCRAQGRTLDRALLQRVLGVSPEPSLLNEARRVPDFVAMASRRDYDLLDTYDRDDWHTTWAHIGTLAADEDWHRTRAQQLDRLRKLPRHELETAGAWTELFDEVTAAVQGHVRFQINPSAADPHVTAVKDTIQKAQRLGTGLVGGDATTRMSLMGVGHLVGVLAQKVLKSNKTLPQRVERQKRALITASHPSLQQSMLLMAGL